MLDWMAASHLAAGAGVGGEQRAQAEWELRWAVGQELQHIAGSAGVRYGGEMSPFEVASHHRSLEQVLAAAWSWGTDISDIIIQDEYTHDVIVPLPDGWLVYDTT